MKKFLIGLGIVIAILGGLWLYATGTPSVPEQSDFELDITALRSMAMSQSGALPEELNTLVVDKGQMPAWAAVAGSTAAPFDRVGVSYQIRYGDRYIVVDAATPVDQASEVIAENLQLLKEMLIGAEKIVFTHTHNDHIDLLKTMPELPDLVDNMVLTEAQYNEPNFGIQGFPAGSLDQLEPLAYEQYYALAPGVVLIQSPGHTQGSQMVFIRLANGTEFLLVGDVVWNMANVEMLRGRPRAIGAWFIQGRPGQVAHQIRTLHGLLETDVKIIVSHDAKQLNELVAANHVGQTFVKNIAVAPTPAATTETPEVSTAPDLTTD